MGIDAGFDMVPRLSKSALDRFNWDSFIRRVKEEYKDDDRVEIKPNYIEFNVGEHPLLPFEGHKFLRFSSKISGSLCGDAQEYVSTVSLIAEVSFGSRALCWSEIYDQYGHYGWKEVHESIRTYEQRDPQERPTSIAQLITGTDPIADMGLSLYEIRSIPGKGKGLVARFNISKGARIIVEKPLFTITPAAASIESNVIAKVRALSKDQQRQFLSLHNNFQGKSIFGGICKTNALPCGVDAIVGGVYPTICLINHCCVPNAHHSWNSKTNSETVHALRYIQAGEEIMIAYDYDKASAPRRANLKNSFGFDCSCRLCSLPRSELQKSDERRLRIKQLDEAIGDSSRVMNTPVLADCQEMLRLLDEEYDGGSSPPDARLYYDAFQIAITHSDQARASVFGERMYKARVVCEGEDSPATVCAKNFMQHPAQHLNFGASKRWRTTKTAVPKGLNGEQFEKWLWRSQSG
ncbi:SET domain-containing protein [Decorospora gaudefroyi]|uniref:SET domain-containing protein n=1 Tax=Decorospora gaudefroyi TaxID=184978 RepID=A0A6A5KQ03_9PLEO|nr:SET domain-containing protein [Decorospora gaudefroyi]